MKIVFILMLKMATLVGYVVAQESFPVKPLGKTIYSGVFTGNGLLGTMTYIKAKDAVRIDIGRTDVYDHRVNRESALFDKARLPIGHFEIALPDTICAAAGDIAYRSGQATATIETAKSSLHIKMLTLAHRNLIYIELSSSRGQVLPSDWSWIAEDAQSPRMAFGYVAKPDNYQTNPKGVLEKNNDVSVYKQPLLAGGGYATAWKSLRRANKVCYLVSVGYSKQSDQYVDEAIDAINSFPINRLDDEIATHQQSWKNYYAKSTLRIPDVQLQQFYNMQLYKLASATGEDKPAMDLQGPWTAATPWPAYWHNLNIQLAYSPVFTANHLEIAGSLMQLLDREQENLAGNVPEPYRYNSAAIGRSSSPDLISPVFLELGKEDYNWEDGRKELGNLTWIMHSYYKYYRYSMDSKAYDRLFPLLKRAVNYYLHLLEKDTTGKYHIAVRTHSPEYPGSYHYDSNYDLSILQWGLTALISLDKERGGKDPLHKKWTEVLANLRDYPQDESGFMIAKDLPYAQSHRHYSHLMMIYPFYLVNWDQPENRDLISRSIAHWQSKTSALQGYSFSGAASMYAMMGKGDDALRSLHTLLTKYVKPNTLYAETGPVIETPLAAMSTVQELCLQYWDGKVRVFPAIPSTWKEVYFENFLTDGAFLISARRKEGKNIHVKILSKEGGEIQIDPNLTGNVSWSSAQKNVKLLKHENARYVFFMPKGSEVVLFRD
ncbi:hypothetical protein PQ465_02810 [Sphingobacterium oryzagri]|uniref:Alpha-L-fucosidase n=1 Tax=Sphingobacterium oryzagri TaxID=3025669 RepID=A0ABY7WJG1_9SPHI|nr:hypothetical protein [Sphingobacterium sp. KACC 22765]WDF69323.1 hypothetical protein PQ465_02810 [Sphingobacterium sp. KACC 22765]